MTWGSALRVWTVMGAVLVVELVCVGIWAVLT